MSGKLFLGGISPNTDDTLIREHFGQYGTVIDSAVMYKDGKHRGFGFVTFEDPGAAESALAEEQVIDGRIIDVKEALPQGEAPVPVPRPSRGDMSSHGRSNGHDRHDRHRDGPPAGAGPRPGPRTDKVFVGGLTQTTTDEQLRDYFAQYGTLIDVVVMKDRASQRSRGFGFVQYDDTEPVERVMENYSSHQLDGKWVEVKRAEPKDRMAPPPRSRHSDPPPGYGDGQRGGMPPAGPPSQFYPWGGAYPPHPYGGYGMGYGYYHQPQGYPYGAGYDPYYGAPPSSGGMPPGHGPPPSSYPTPSSSSQRSRPY